MNRINTLFQKKNSRVLSVYFTAGYPEGASTVKILEQLQLSGVDMVEVGMPFSDPLADGPVIQDSSSKALKNGMSLKLLFTQLSDIRKTIQMPLLLMGYINPVLQYGVEAFCKKCSDIGIDGVIIPDLPLDEYREQFQATFEKYDIRFIFLITPQTSDERIKMIDSISNGFIYVVSSASTTGAKNTIAQKQVEYFNRVKSLHLKNPLIIGFGISNNETFTKACDFANGAIIGSAFVKLLGEENYNTKINPFISSILKA